MFQMFLPMHILRKTKLYLALFNGYKRGPCGCPSNTGVTVNYKNLKKSNKQPSQANLVELNIATPMSL